MLKFALLIPNQDLDHTISSYGIVEELNENKLYLNEFIQLTKQVADTSVCYISILNSERQYVISSKGLHEFPLLKRDSICQLTVDSGKPTIVHDLSRDERTKHLELANDTYKYYAGFPLINNEGVAIGALCIMNEVTIQLGSSQISMLESISKIIVERLDTRRQLIGSIKEINQNFNPGECAGLFCLSGELSHLQHEVINAKNKLAEQREELRISNNNLTQFAHRIAHDLKAPLRSINAFSQLIRKGDGLTSPNENRGDYFEYINSSIHEVNRMVDNLLSIAALKSNVRPEKVSISKLIENIEILFYDSLDSKVVKLVKPQVDVQVYGYKALLKQLFQNIISNGIKYSDDNKNSFVKISFDLKESSVLVNISDNGIGISENDLNSIFEPFQRASNHDDIEGQGIGLDTCKVIVNDMGKELKIESELGLGTSVIFEIPLS